MDAEGEASARARVQAVLVRYRTMVAQLTAQVNPDSEQIYANKTCQCLECSRRLLGAFPPCCLQHAAWRPEHAPMCCPRAS